MTIWEFIDKLNAFIRNGNIKKSTKLMIACDEKLNTVFTKFDYAIDDISDTEWEDTFILFWLSWFERK